MIKQENFGAYLANPAINASLMKKLRRSPLTAFGVDDVDTEAKAFGGAYHTWVLERDLFEGRYFEYDPDERPNLEQTFGAKVNKEWRAAQFEAAGNKGVLEANDMVDIRGMDKQLKANNPNAVALVANSEHEVSIYQTVEVGGYSYEGKARFDGINPEAGFFVDLKTTKEAHPSGFGREAGQYAYHIQMAWYKKIAELEYNRTFEVFIVAQERTAPYNSGLYKVSEAMLNKGEYELNNLLELAAHVKATGELSSYEVFSSNKYGVLPLDIPNYYVNEYDFNFK
jgi:exodeoxyribonuclease VIII